ncbi:MAG: DUF29 domain-containing protein [Synechococcales bacterium]|nr:DUF29 domain-containing protein [Synechococcales bacterium]
MAQAFDPSTSANSPLYDCDYHQWLRSTAQLLRDGRFSQVDWLHLIEEIEDMGRSERRAVESNLEVVLMHLLKYRYQADRRSPSWRYTLTEHRNRLAKLLRDSPSLRRYLDSCFDDCYQTARRLAADETGLELNQFPDQPPFSPTEALDMDYLPD